MGQEDGGGRVGMGRKGGSKGWLGMEAGMLEEFGHMTQKGSRCSIRMDS